VRKDHTGIEQDRAHSKNGNARGLDARLAGEQQGPAEETQTHDFVTPTRAGYDLALDHLQGRIHAHHTDVLSLNSTAFEACNGLDQVEGHALGRRDVEALKNHSAAIHQGETGAHHHRSLSPQVNPSGVEKDLASTAEGCVDAGWQDDREGHLGMPLELLEFGHQAFGVWLCETHNPATGLVRVLGLALHGEQVEGRAQTSQRLIGDAQGAVEEKLLTRPLVLSHEGLRQVVSLVGQGNALSSQQRRMGQGVPGLQSGQEGPG